MLNVGEITSSLIFSAFATPETKVVFPAPKSPFRRITSPLVKLEAILEAICFVSSFEFSLIPELNVYSFKSADIERLHCVASHRTENAFAEIHDRMKKYDLITGKIANDATNTTLTAYISGAYGQMGTSDADEFCIKRLLPNKLQNQFCFRTEKALKCLAFIKAEKIWLR